MSRILKREYVELEQGAKPAASRHKTHEPARTVCAESGCGTGKQDCIKSGDIIRRAETEASNILEQARREGKRKGFEYGYGMAAAQCRVKTDEAVQKAEAACHARCEELRGARTEEIGHLKDGLLKLGFDLARKILYLEIDRSDQAYLRLFQKAASHAGRTDKAVLKAGPRGCEIALRHMEEFKKSIPGINELEICRSGDDNGLCVIETPAGSVDASVSVQLLKSASIAGIDEETAQ